MAEAKIEKKVIVPAVAEVVEERVLLELTRDEAERIYSVSGAMVGNEHGMRTVYEALQRILGGYGSKTYVFVTPPGEAPRFNKRV